jgi:hypothetical protein
VSLHKVYFRFSPSISKVLHFANKFKCTFNYNFTYYETMRTITVGNKNKNFDN